MQIYKNLDENEYFEQVKFINSMLNDLCKYDSNVSISSVKVNLESIKDVISRVDKRKYYFKVFHKDMKLSEYKETALYCFWILKLRPFWINGNGFQAEKINEKFCLHMVLCLLKKYNNLFNAKDGIDIKYANELIYSFRFRDLSKEALILMLEPYYYDYLKNSDTIF